MFIGIRFFSMKMNIPDTKYSIYIHMNALELNLDSVTIFLVVCRMKMNLQLHITIKEQSNLTSSHFYCIHVQFKFKVYANYQFYSECILKEYPHALPLNCCNSNAKIINPISSNKRCSSIVFCECNLFESFDNFSDMCEFDSFNRPFHNNPIPITQTE